MVVLPLVMVGVVVTAFVVFSCYMWTLVQERGQQRREQPFPWPLTQTSHFDRVWIERDMEQDRRDRERNDIQHAHSVAMRRLGGE